VAAAPASFSPNGDRSADTTRLAWSSDEPISGTLKVMRGSTLVRLWRVSGVSGAVTWNGRDSAGRLVGDGRLSVAVRGSDALANSARTTTPLVVDRTVGSLRWSASWFYPQDGDRLLPSSVVSLRVARTARLTLRILDASGTEIRRAWTSREVAAGTASWRWDGRTASGAWAPQGRYVAELTAVSSLGTSVLRRAVFAGAFRATPSTTSPRAGTTFSVTFRSVEPLGRKPRVTFRQAGRTTVLMTVVRRSDGSWRASVTVAAGAPGAALVTIAARDSLGGRNQSSLTVTVP
jgi:hypothetical protein